MMSLSTIKLFFDKSVILCKKYWQLFVGLGIAVIVMVVSRGQQNQMRQVLDVSSEKAREDLASLQEAHDKKLAAEKARAEEQRLAAERMAQKIIEIEEKYKIDTTTLSKKKKRQLEDLLSDSSSQEQISKGLADILGAGFKS